MRGNRSGVPSRKASSPGRMARLRENSPGSSRSAAPGRRLPTAPAGHPLLEPLVMLLSFYGFAEALSRARGFDPDVPRGLKKVTETI